MRYQQQCGTMVFSNFHQTEKVCQVNSNVLLCKCIICIAWISKMFFSKGHINGYTIVQRPNITHGLK